MLALRLEYLTGRAVATSYNDRSTAEWPPHPARLFSALVATWAEQDPPQPRERQALEWLEALPPPRLVCSEAHRRCVATHFVPVNDPSLLSKRFSTLSEELDAAQENMFAFERAMSVATSSGTAGAIKKAEAALTKQARQVNLAKEKYAKEIATVISVGASNAAILKTAMSLLPESRERLPRSFPSVTPHDPVVYFVWPDAEGYLNRPALNALAFRLVSVGHSSSLVHARWVDDAPASTWMPSSTGTEMMRVPSAGQTTRLIDEFSRHQAVEPRVLPFRPQRYAPCRPTDAVEIAEGVFSRDDWIILRRAGGAPLRLTRAAGIAKATRKALMKHLEQSIPEMLSGHADDGRPSNAAHLAVVALPHVGHRHADGRVMGVALVFPRGADEHARKQVLRALALWERAARIENGAADDDASALEIGLGDGIQIQVERVVWGKPGTAALRAETWCAPCREWLSVTPVALDRNPGDLHSRNPMVAAAATESAEQIIASSCERIGLPRPSSVTVEHAAMWAGAAPAGAFGPFPAEAGKLRKVKVHARLLFDQPVFGPVLVGAGRFQGLGLFRPVIERAA